MIITTWTAFVVFRRAAGPPFSSIRIMDDDVVETEAVSVLEHWLQKIEQESVKVFRLKSENRTESKAETRYNMRAFPSLNQDLVAARSKPEPWEKFEDRRPQMQTLAVPSSMTCHPIAILEIFPLSNTLLASSSSQNLLDDRLKTQFTRWSQTRVYRVTSDMRKDAMQERLDKVRTSISRVMFEGVTEADKNRSDINIHSSLSKF